MSNQGTHRFQLPATEDDLWEAVVRALLLQRDVQEADARDPRRLLEELAFHQRFCEQALTQRFVEDTATWLAKERDFGSPRDKAQAWIAALERWELLQRRSIGKEVLYELPFHELDDYFAACHVAERWQARDRAISAWIAQAQPYCCAVCPGVVLPPLRASLRNDSFEQRLLFLVGVLKSKAHEEYVLQLLAQERDALSVYDSFTTFQRYLNNVPRETMFNRLLQALSRCRSRHPAITRGARQWIALRVTEDRHRAEFLRAIETGLVALGRARLADNGAPIFNYFVRALGETEHYEIRGSAAVALGMLDDARAVKPLIIVLRKHDAGARWEACQALIRMGGAAVQPLLMAMKIQDGYLRLYGMQILAEIGTVAVEPLLAALRHRDARAYWLVGALAYIGDLRAVDPLVGLLREAQGKLRGAAAKALAFLGDDRAVEPVLGALLDGDPDVRREIVRALGAFDDQRAVAALSQVRDNDPVESVRWEAERVIEERTTLPDIAGRSGATK